MPNPADFEEKEYEVPLYLQLLVGGQSSVWSPGQVLEHQFGFDAALEVTALSFWNHVGFTVPLTGVMLPHFRWGFVWRKTAHRPLPTFRLNLFLQAKRPDGMKNRPAGLRQLGLNSPYWRFQTNAAQQRTLERVADRLGHRALVTYACPAFTGLGDLYTSIANGTLVQRSTFARVGRLVNHGSWNYDAAGCVGYPASEPEKAEDPPFQEQIRGLAETGEWSEEPTPEANQRDLLVMEESIVGALSDDREDPRVAAFMQTREVIGESWRERGGDYRDVGRAYATVLAFAAVFSLLWFTVGPPR